MARFCKKCNSVIPNKIVIDDKEYILARRKYCVECSPMFSKKHYLLEKNDRGGLPESKKCPICDRNFKYTKNDVCSTCRSFYQRHKTKCRCVEYLGGKCNECEIQDVDILTFHHKDEKIKSFTISHNLGSVEWDKLKRELDKCELLCYNCHMKHHKEEDFFRKEKIKKFYAGGG